MLLRFVYQDFMADRVMNNSSEADLKNHHFILGAFIDHCLDKDITNFEDITTNLIKVTFSSVRIEATAQVQLTRDYYVYASFLIIALKKK